jgi:hypothetical protein
MQNELDVLDMLGQFLMEHLRDSAIEYGTSLLQGKQKTVSSQRIQKALFPGELLTERSLSVKAKKPNGKRQRLDATEPAW